MRMVELYRKSNTVKNDLQRQRFLGSCQAYMMQKKFSTVGFVSYRPLEGCSSLYSKKLLFYSLALVCKSLSNAKLSISSITESIYFSITLSKVLWL